MLRKRIQPATADKIGVTERNADAVAISEKHLRLAECYARHQNAARAGREAGYSPRRAKETACEILARPEVAAEVRRRIAERRQQFLEARSIQISRHARAKLLAYFGGDELAATRAIERIILATLDSQSASLALLDAQRVALDSPTRYATLARAGFKCQACGAKPRPDNDVELEIDHILPITRGGRDVPANRQVLCCACNVSKGNRFAVNHHKK